MSLRFQLERLAQTAVDWWYLACPRPRPGVERLRDCRLVSHRGEHDNRGRLENTIAAFTAAAEAGVWGIEFDLRWTRDLQPVVIHDEDARRVFGEDLVVAETDLADLQRRLPEVPSLAQVVAAFGGRTHLMIELKRCPDGDDEIKARRLAEALQPLEPARDYHILALDPDLFAPAGFAGAAACVLVAELNPGQRSREALAAGLGGLCGHFVLIDRRLLRRHREAGQKLGTGFPGSRFAFYRELNRGVDWIFTNHARRLARIRAELLQRRA